MNTTGVLKEKLEAQKGVSKAGKDWIKQEFIIDTGDQYNPIALFHVFKQDKVDKLAALNVGDSIDVEFNIKCREWKGKYFTDLEAWRIEKTKQADAPKVPQKEEEKDELPF